MISREDQNGIVILNWKDTRYVRLLSTKHEPLMVPSSPQIIQEPSSTNNDQILTQHKPSTSQHVTPMRKRRYRKAVEKPLAKTATTKESLGYTCLIK